MRKSKMIKLSGALALVVAVLGVEHVDADTITTVDVAFPTDADIIAATPDEAGFGSNLKSTELSFSQTVQSSGFDLNTVYIKYDDVDGHTINLSIFPVADVNAASHAEPPTGLILSETVVLPATTGSTVAAISLDAPLTLAANTGTDGYAVYITTDIKDQSFLFFRTTSSEGSVYDGGVAYEDGAYKNSGDRDFSLALDSTVIPEPATLGLIMLSGGVLVAVRRFSRM